VALTRSAAASKVARVSAARVQGGRAITKTNNIGAFHIKPFTGGLFWSFGENVASYVCFCNKMDSKLFRLALHNQHVSDKFACLFDILLN
jgi:hypothetical protein